MDGISAVILQRVVHFPADEKRRSGSGKSAPQAGIASECPGLPQGGHNVFPTAPRHNCHHCTAGTGRTSGTRGRCACSCRTSGAPPPSPRETAQWTGGGALRYTGKGRNRQEKNKRTLRRGARLVLLYPCVVHDSDILRRTRQETGLSPREFSLPEAASLPQRHSRRRAPRGRRSGRGARSSLGPC